MRRKVISGLFEVIDKKERNFNKELEVRIESISERIEELNKPISKLLSGKKQWLPTLRK